MQSANQFADDLKEVLSTVSSLTGISATDIAKATTNDALKARRFCVFVLRSKHHPPGKIAASFKLPHNRKADKSKCDQEMIDAVSKVTGIESGAIIGDSKAASIIRARFMLALLAKTKKPWLSQSEIAALMNKGNHVTARNALIQARNMIDTDPAFKAAFDRAMAALEK